MALVPRTVVDKMQFYETHLPAFAADPSAIGLTPEQVATLQAKADAARAAYEAQRAALQAARAATQAFNQRLSELSVYGSAVIESIRSHAKVTGDPGVYTAALLDSPARPSAVELPGAPNGLSTELRSEGSLFLKWRCKNPRDARGTMYELARAIGPGEAFERVAIVGKRQYVDSTIPKGATEIQYRIRAFRSTGAGDWAYFTVNFGTNGRAPLPQYLPDTHALAA